MSIIPEKENLLLIHPDDNVLVVMSRNNQINFGHKIARFDIEKGQDIIKYGCPIGQATENIKKDEWVHSHNLTSSLQPATSFIYNPASAKPVLAADNRTTFFSGYKRGNGKTGIRNEIWIIPTVGCINQTAGKLAEYGRKIIKEKNIAGIDSVQAWTHPYGCSQLGEDHLNTRRILANLAAHPNAGGVMLIGLGCENNQINSMLEEPVLQNRKNLRSLVVQEVDDEVAAGEKIIDLLISEAAEFKRESCPISDLIVGLKCGGSDSLSGLTANPLLGHFSDWLTAKGGSVILTEIPEFFGAEQQLLDRSANEDIFSAFTGLLQKFRDNFSANNLPVYENPSPGNRQGGITTLEEKSLGCVFKAGQAQVNSVLDYGEQIKVQGLSILEGPGNDIVACTALAAAGAQLILFTTGRGTPLGGPVPTMKIASNLELGGKKPHWIDFTARTEFSKQNDSSTREIIDLVIKTIQGQYLCQNEKNDYREISIYKQGVTL